MGNLIRWWVPMTSTPFTPLDVDLDLTGIDAPYKFELITVGDKVKLLCFPTYSDAGIIYADLHKDDFVPEWSQYDITCHACEKENRTGKEIFSATTDVDLSDDKTEHICLCSSCFDEFTNALEKLVENNTAVFVSLEV